MVAALDTRFPDAAPVWRAEAAKQRRRAKAGVRAGTQGLQAPRVVTPWIPALRFAVAGKREEADLSRA